MKITYEDVLDEVTKIVNEQGRDHVYEKPDGSHDCLYFADSGAPSCLVGHWIHALDNADFENAVRQAERTSPFSAQELIDLAIEYNLDIEYESSAIQFLSEAQAMQDRGETWGDALDYAINRIESGQI